MIVKHKVFFAWNMDKEQTWLEELARQGYILKDTKLFTYYFEKTEPQDVVYQFDFQILRKKEKAEYLELFQDWTFVTRFGGWYYFYKPKSHDKSDRIYSDNRSKSAMFRRLLGFLVLVGFPLYYQMLFVFPHLDAGKLSFPGFYFFFRILALILMAVHLFAVSKVFGVLHRYRRSIQE
jgi:hypothetical protein